MADALKLVYTDTFEHAFDEKGRITVPKEWRGDGFETRLYVMPPEPGCLRIYPGSWLAAKMRILETAPVSDPRRAKFEELTARIQSVEIDPQNRINIKDRVRLEAGIGKNAVLTGRFDHFEIWSTEKWKAHSAGPLTMASVLTEVGL